MNYRTIHDERRTAYPRLSRGAGSRRGYTTVEMVIALAILSTVIFTTVKVYETIRRAYAQVDEKSRLERSIVFSMEQVTKDIRQARSVITLGATAGSAVTNTNIHLDSAGVTVFTVSLPNVTDPVNATCDAQLTFFLRKMPDGTVKLFQRMKYYTGAYTEAFPAMGETDRYRLGTGVTFSPVTEPTPLQKGSATPTPLFTGNTPTPNYNLGMSRMAGVYNSPDLNFDDVCIYYDSANNLVGLGLTLSLKSSSLSNFMSTISKRRLQMTSSVALRAD